MSILGYSASYFLPEYWSETPLYGEKIIPLLDYILSTDFAQADKLANAFYTMENKYRNTADLPISAIEAIIEESGYGYVKDLLGDEVSIRLLVYLLVLIHQLKGSKLGIEVVLNLLKREINALVQNVIGNPTITSGREVYNITTSDYVTFTGFTVDDAPFELNLQIRTPANFANEQCLASCGLYGFYIGINTNGQLVLSLGSDARSSWDIADRKLSTNNLLPDTNYYIRLTFDGFEYALKVSTDNKKFEEYITVAISTPINIHNGVVYIGVDDSTGVVQYPFQGFINLTPFAVEVSNVKITEWFEQFPVGEEDTFSVDADLDLGVTSTDFFEKFAVFVSKYVYPTLSAFEAKLNFENNLTFLPYVRQRITYVATADLRRRATYLVKDQETDPVATLPFAVLGAHGGRVEMEVLADLYIYKYGDNVIYADSSTNPTQLYNADDSYYTGEDWTIEEGKVYYLGNEATYDGIYEG